MGHKYIQIYILVDNTPLHRNSMLFAINASSPLMSIEKKRRKENKTIAETCDNIVAIMKLRTQLNCDCSRCKEICTSNQFFNKKFKKPYFSILYLL